VLDDDAARHVRNIIDAVDDFLKMMVNLVADTEGDSVPAGRALW